MESSRLPGKPLAEIEGLPMIVHVYHRALEADCGEVIVAAGDKEICEVIKKHGGEAILTKSSHPVSYTHLPDQETSLHLICRIQKEKK